MTPKSTILAACIFAAGAAFAEDAHHPDAAKPAPAESPAKPAAPAMGGMEGMHGHMGRMQEHMKLMREQMSNIRAARDPKERERLMDEHMRTMEESMSMMMGMMKGPQK